MHVNTTTRRDAETMGKGKHEKGYAAQNCRVGKCSKKLWGLYEKYSYQTHTHNIPDYHVNIKPSQIHTDTHARNGHQPCALSEVIKQIFENDDDNGLFHIAAKGKINTKCNILKLSQK